MTASEILERADKINHAKKWQNLGAELIKKDFICPEGTMIPLPLNSADFRNKLIHLLYEHAGTLMKEAIDGS